jgi:hypothetical protein
VLLRILSEFERVTLKATLRQPGEAAETQFSPCDKVTTGKATWSFDVLKLYVIDVLIALSKRASTDLDAVYVEQ